jgi:hypothetical protein
MTSTGDRLGGEDVWARAVAEDAAEQEAAAKREAAEESVAAEGAVLGEGVGARADREDEDPFGGSSRAGSGATGSASTGWGTTGWGTTGSAVAGELGPLVEEVRRLAGAVGDRVQEVSRNLQGLGGLGDLGLSGGLDQLAAPIREKHPEVYRHLAAAGGELLAAYRAAVSGHERRWSAEKPSSTEHIDLD